MVLTLLALMHLQQALLYMMFWRNGWMCHHWITENYSLSMISTMKIQVNTLHCKYRLSASVQFSSIAQSCLTLCNPMNRSMPGFPVHHKLLESTQTHTIWVGDAIQSSHPLSSPSPPAPNPSQHQSLFQWVSSSNEVAEVLEFQLQHQVSAYTY